MEPLREVEGTAAPLMRANVDTDVIIPMGRLLRAARDELGRYAFEPLRYREDGSENPDFVLNQPAFRDAPILLGGRNFGCGSSREMAVWAIKGMGIRCVIAPSFGTIFQNNCFQNSVLPIELPEETVEAMAAEAREGGANARFTVDLAANHITCPSGRTIAFEVMAARREALLEGLDDIGMTMRRADAIATFQARDRTARPWIHDVDIDGTAG